MSIDTGIVSRMRAPPAWFQMGPIQLSGVVVGGAEQAVQVEGSDQKATYAGVTRVLLRRTAGVKVLAPASGLVLVAFFIES